MLVEMIGISIGYEKIFHLLYIYNVYMLIKKYTKIKL
jgi:hypothetical protein